MSVADKSSDYNDLAARITSFVIENSSDERLRGTIKEAVDLTEGRPLKAIGYVVLSTTSLFGSEEKLKEKAKGLGFSVVEGGADEVR